VLVVALLVPVNTETLFDYKSNELAAKARHHGPLLLTFGLYPSTQWPDNYDLSFSSLANQLQSLPYRSSMGGYDSFEIKELHPGLSPMIRLFSYGAL